MQYVDGNVDNLAEPVCSFVQSDKFGDHTGCLSTEFSRRDMSGERRRWRFVA